MPTYEYLCEACKHEWELEQRMSEAPAKKCPKCGKLKAHRQISQGNFILKGGGWYSDLYSSTSKKSGGSSGSSSESKSETKVEAKAETKSEAKAETKSEPKKPKAAAE